MKSCDNICCYMMHPRFTIVLLLRGSIHLTNQTSATDVRTCSRDASPCWSPSHSVFGHRFLCLTGRFYNSGCFKRPFNTDWGHFALGDIQRLPKCVALNSFGHATGPQDTFLIMEPKWYPEVLHQDPAASVLGRRGTTSTFFSQLKDEAARSYGINCLLISQVGCEDSGPQKALDHSIHYQVDLISTAHWFDELL